MNELPFITAKESNRYHCIQGFHYSSSWMHCLGNVYESLPCKMGNSMSSSTIPAFRWCLLSRCLANVFFDMLSRKRVLANRCLAMEYCSFQASCHSAPFIRLFIPNSLLVYHCSFFPRFLLVTSSCGSFFLCGDYFPTPTTAPTLKRLGRATPC
jgi:hypothetical protein